MKDQELPKWFTKGGGVCYKKGSAVKNPFTGASTELTNVELSMYDYIKGAEYVASTNKTVATNLIKALYLFRKENANAYMVLLD